MPRDRTNRILALAVAAVGFTAIVTQTILLREFLSVFYGNELVIGIVLAVWMILTGGGSLLGRWISKAEDKIRVALLFLFLTSLLPLVTVFLLDTLRNIVFPIGALIGVVESLYSSFILLAPYCLLSGSLFTLLAAIVSEQTRSNRIPEVYALEAIGGVVGGLTLNLFLVFVLSNFQTLCLLALIDLGICLYLSVQLAKRTYQIAVLTVGAVLLLVTARLDLDRMAKEQLFPGQELLFHKDTPYGNLVITQVGTQKNFYENGSLLFVTGDPVSNEDAVHYAMVQHPHPRNVLLIAGGISGTTDEILKYGVEHADYVELNPSIIDIGRKYTPALDDPRIDAISEDGRRFVRNAKRMYDVALINVPDPSTAQINRYYSVEFLQELKNVVTPNAVIGMNLLESVDYMSGEARQISSVIYNTLKSQFKHVLIIPGLRNHYLASNRELTTDIAGAVARRNISTISVNRYYVDDQLLGRRSSEIMSSLDTSTVLNRDFTPIAYFRQLQYWLSYFGLKPWLPAAIAGVIFLAIVARLNVISLGVFTGGFAASSIEVVLLIAFQVVYGYVYQATGLVITVFMAGLAGGSFLGRRIFKPVGYATFAGIQIALVVYSLLLPVILTMLKGSADSDVVVWAVFFLLTLVIAALVGVEFSFAVRLTKVGITSAASTLYGVDLIGSALGALVLSIYILPLFGITLSGIIIALVCLASATTSLIAGKRGLVPLEGGNSYA